MLLILIFFACHWYGSLFFQTFLYHRYGAHEMFTMHPWTEKVFIFFAWVFTGSSYILIGPYVIMHRLHHAFTDTELDPHSPKYDKNIWRMMWHTREVYYKINKGEYPVDPKFKKNVPGWPWFEKNIGNSWISRIVWGTFYILVYLFAHFYLGASWWWFLLLPIHFLMAPFHGAIINWFAHTIGQKRFTMNDTSTNIVPVDLVMLAEAYHNNHHKYPARPNFGIKWYEIDPVYPFIKLFHWMRIIKLKPIKTT
ncbi:acyl-CoA desaturase [Candidatus Nomurabacteria bacterium]|jgi:stearoyl-CoA desaturase (delta-9 desaturase)|nr:MAG: acyl-CoA desaturase [Candidatus Nomurabacteria bacterium]